MRIVHTCTVGRGPGRARPVGERQRSACDGECLREGGAAVGRVSTTPTRGNRGFGSGTGERTRPMSQDGVDGTTEWGDGEIMSFEPDWKRAIRLALQEVAESSATNNQQGGEDEDDSLLVVSRQNRILRGEECEVVLYSSWLADQRTHDDMRFANARFLQYDVPGCSQPLLVEQNFRLGKGGMAWDAAFILAEYLLQGECASLDNRPAVVVELGCGIGTAGLALAMAPQRAVDVFLTDIGKVLRICRRNVELNHSEIYGSTETSSECCGVGNGDGGGGGGDGGDGDGAGSSSSSSSSSSSGKIVFGPREPYSEEERVGATSKPISTVSVSELRWGRESTAHWAEKHLNRQVDLVIGADIVVPSFYSTEDLLETLNELAGENTTVVLSVKRRAADQLAAAFDEFYNDLRRSFASVVVKSPNSVVRHPEDAHNIIIATGRLRQDGS